MLHRTVAFFAIGVTAVVFASSNSSAQPGGKGPGPGASKQLEAELARMREQIKELDAKLSKLQGGFKKDEKGAPPFAKGPGGFPMPGGPGGFPMPGGPGGFGKGPGGQGGGAGGQGGAGGPGKGPGFMPPAGSPLANLDPVKLKKVLALYELIYGDSKTEPGKGGERTFGKKWGDFKKDFGRGGPPFGKKGMDKKKEASPPTPPTPPLSRGVATPGGPPAASGSLESRIDRLAAELEQLRRELKKKK